MPASQKYYKYWQIHHSSSSTSWKSWKPGDYPEILKSSPAREIEKLWPSPRNPKNRENPESGQIRQNEKTWESGLPGGKHMGQAIKTRSYLGNWKLHFQPIAGGYWNLASWGGGGFLSLSLISFFEVEGSNPDLGLRPISGFSFPFSLLIIVFDLKGT